MMYTKTKAWYAILAWFVCLLTACGGIPEVSLEALHEGLIEANAQSSRWKLVEWYREEPDRKVVLYDANNANQGVFICFGRGSNFHTQGIHIPESDFDELNEINANSSLYWKLSDSLYIYNQKSQKLPLKIYERRRLDSNRMQLVRFTVFGGFKEYFTLSRQSGQKGCFGVQ